FVYFIPHVEGKRLPAPLPKLLEPLPRRESDLPPGKPRIISGNATFNLILGQARVDLESLRLPIFGENPLEGRDVVVAGIPRYTGIFCRDILTSAWQSSLFDPDWLDSALTRVAQLRGRKFDPWRDKEPNRIPHERRLDPEAAIGNTNREIYYGD